MRWSYIVGAVVIAGILIGSWIWFRAAEPPDDVGFDAPEIEAPPIDVEPTVGDPVVPEQPVVEFEPAPPPEPVPPPVLLPPLGESDAFVRERFEVPASPMLAEWLTQDDLVRRAAVVLQNAERGDYPRRQLNFIKVAGPFKVTSRGDKTFMDPASYRRFDGVTEAVTSIPPEQFVGLFDLLEPLLTDAVGELGVRDANVRTSLNIVMDLILDTPVIDTPVEVIRPNVMYQYADAELELLEPLQKQLLRAGPENLTRIQSYARQLKAARQ